MAQCEAEPLPNNAIARRRRRSRNPLTYRFLGNIFPRWPASSNVVSGEQSNRVSSERGEIESTLRSPGLANQPGVVPLFALGAAGGIGAVVAVCVEDL